MRAGAVRCEWVRTIAMREPTFGIKFSTKASNPKTNQSLTEQTASSRPVNTPAWSKPQTWASVSGWQP